MIFMAYFEWRIRKAQYGYLEQSYTLTNGF